MSAAERLRELNSDLTLTELIPPIPGREDHVFVKGEKAVALINALPEIIAVVEAAELMRESDCEAGCLSFDESLAALDAKLAS